LYLLLSLPNWLLEDGLILDYRLHHELLLILTVLAHNDGLLDNLRWPSLLLDGSAVVESTASAQQLLFQELLTSFGNDLLVVLHLRWLSLLQAQLVSWALSAIHHTCGHDSAPATLSVGAHSLPRLRSIVSTLLLDLILVLLIAVLGIFLLVDSGASILKFLWLILLLPAHRLLIVVSISHLISLLLHAIGLPAGSFLVLVVLLILVVVIIVVAGVLLLAFLVRVGVTAKFFLSLDELL